MTRDTSAIRCDGCKGSGLIKASLFGAPSGWSICVSCEGIGYIRQSPKLAVWDPTKLVDLSTPDR